ncbi:Ohr family peroxiredoxin [Ferrovibrio sp.]|uniref:Ohr family peroxiredoxin n=1 Tax=Ferrovibrio sp. TaxID=1917215 RepID=UPI0025BC413A|nr:Ohr family peroxiredoxin [Ferrovibrio sp.]MBX3455015.1 Ohr family peroxiredoxin [Ferrovibrio sp.]
MTPLYTTTATATGGRSGRVTSADGIIDLVLAMPKELGGPGNAANPETFFASGYAACFQGALGLVARNQKITLPAGNTVTVTIGIGKDETSFGLNAKIVVHLPGLDQATATALANAAHQVCPYSKATRGNIESVVEATV